MKTSHNMYTVVEARAYLRKRGICISHQALYALIARHRSQCQRIGGTEKKAGLWLIPAALVRTYRPSAQQQAAGRTSRPVRKAKAATKIVDIYDRDGKPYGRWPVFDT